LIATHPNPIKIISAKVIKTNPIKFFGKKIVKRKISKKIK